MRDPCLQDFHPLVREWFTRTYPAPTEVQRLIWPKVRTGAHVLVTAPTGSGKTLGAFLWGINQLFTGVWEGGGVRILYVSPLKALNNDIRLNLLQPLEGIRALFQDRGAPAPELRVLTRSGDTPPSERQAMIRKPPHILITTPESLNLMLSSPRARGLFTGLRAVVLDEIHAVVSSKRGTHLITAVERLVPLAGEFQRLALSATVRPLDRVADFVGGRRLENPGWERPGEDTPGPENTGTDAAAYRKAAYRNRKVEILRAEGGKRYQVRVLSPLPAEGGPAALPAVAGGGPAVGGHTAATARERWWEGLVSTLRGIIESNHSTLIFTNSRRLTEKLTRLINSGEQLVYAHHGSLSRELRAAVERKLKRGELRGIVATSSLELGIDIGSLDRVVLVGTPFTLSSALQKAGRAGHAVGAVSRADLVPLHARDFVHAAVMARAVMEQRIEEAMIPDRPLDILAQVILSMTGVRTWKIDELFDQVRAAYPYRELSREQFDGVVDMLAGRFQETRIRELRPRVAVDGMSGTVSARKGALRMVYLSGGSIPDRGYFELREAGSGARIGELDEEFVWERSVGDVFTLGAQSWKIVGIDHQKVEVVPSRTSSGLTPFWKGEGVGRDPLFSDLVAGFLGEYDERAGDEGSRIAGSGGFHDAGGVVPNRGIRAERLLMRRHGMDREAALFLIDFLERQRGATGGLPHRRRIVAEHLPGSGGAPGERVVLHTLWGGRVNRPLALALAQALEEEGWPADVVHDDDCVLAVLPGNRSAAGLLGMLRAEELEPLIRRRLGRTGYFGARFRENAARALLLPRQSFSRRVPFWYNRLRSKNLLHAVRSHPRFPVLTETWRTCLRDDFDLDRLAALLDRVVDDAALRPRISSSLAADTERRLQRVLPGYAPADGTELVEWIKERLLVPEDELRVLLGRMAADGPRGPAPDVPGRLAGQVVGLRLDGSPTVLYTAEELMPRVLGSLVGPSPDRLAALLEEWLRFYGPLTPGRICGTLGVGRDRLGEALALLRRKNAVVMGPLTEGAVEEEVCDRRNLAPGRRISCRRGFQDTIHGTWTVWCGRASWPGSAVAGAGWASASAGRWTCSGSRGARTRTGKPGNGSWGRCSRTPGAGTPSGTCGPTPACRHRS